MSTIFGTSARDSIVGTADPDSIFVEQGARDTVQGLEGDDFIHFGGELNANDQVDGGDGANDIVRIGGNYVGGLVLTATTLVNVEQLFLEAGFSYDLTIDDATGNTFFWVNGNALLAGSNLVFDGSAETTAQLFIESGDGDDHLIGGDGNDDIEPGIGTDTVDAGLGNDDVNMWEGLDPTDVLVGGDGVDFLHLIGDYSAGLTLTGAMASGFEFITAHATFDFVVTTADDLTAAGSDMTFDVNSFVPGGGAIVFDASAETDAEWGLGGGVSDDTLIGGALGDTIEFLGGPANGGLDKGVGNGGDDVFRFDATFTRDDQVDGGAGFDELELIGDLSAGVNFNSTTMRDIELITVLAFSCDLTVGNNNVTADGFTVDATGVGAGNTLAYDGSAETVSDIIVRGAGSDDTILTGGGDDTISTGAGDDILNGGAGDDVIDLANFFGRDDQVEGGLGFDRLLLAGTYTLGINFASTTLNGVEQVELAAGFDYVLAPGNNNVDADGFTVLGDLLGASDTLNFNGSAETVSDVIVLGGGAPIPWSAAAAMTACTAAA